MESIEQYLYELLYKKDVAELIYIIRNCTDSKLLHLLIANYNWDNGTEFPKIVVTNKYCDIGTALMIFELFGGYSYLLDDKESGFSKSEKAFLSELKDRIANKHFAKQSIKYIPELTKIEKYYINKRHHNISNIFIDGTEGEPIEIIIV